MRIVRKTGREGRKEEKKKKNHKYSGMIHSHKRIIFRAEHTEKQRRNIGRRIGEQKKREEYNEMK